MFRVDLCLFIWHDCILCLCIDDAILLAKNESILADALKAIDSARCAFLRGDSLVSHLGVLVEHFSDGTEKLPQLGLMKQLLDVAGLTDCNPVKTPAAGPLFAHRDSPQHDGSFNCWSSLSMSMCLSNNTQPECTCTVSQHCCMTFCLSVSGSC